MVWCNALCDAWGFVRVLHPVSTHGGGGFRCHGGDVSSAMRLVEQRVQRGIGIHLCFHSMEPLLEVTGRLGWMIKFSV